MIPGKKLTRKATHLSRNNKRRRVRSKVEKEVCQAIADNETSGADLVVAESDDTEEHRQEDESHKLDWLASDSIHEGDCGPVAWNSTSTDQDDITNCNVVVVFVDIVAASEADCG